MPKHKHLWDTYRFPGFLPEHTWFGIFGDPRARVLRLMRRGKKLFAVPVASSIVLSTTGRSAEFRLVLQRYADLPGRGDRSGLLLPVR